MSLYRRSWLCAVAVSVVLAAPAAQAAELEKFLPDDTEVVATINIRQLIDSGLAKKFDLAKELEKGIKSNDEAGKVLKALGLDPLKDISRITIASPGKQDEKRVLFSLQGSFDLAKIHDAADAAIKDHPENLSVSKEDGLRLYQVKSPPKNDVVYVCFINKEVAVASPFKGYVMDAVAKTTGKRDPKFSKALQALVAKQDAKQSFWIAALATTDMKDQLAKNPQTKQLADKLESISAGVGVTNEVKVTLNINTSDEAAAKDIRQKLEGAKALGILAVGGTEELKDYAPILTDVLNAFKFNQDKGNVAVELTVSSTVIDKAAGMIKPQK